MTDYEVKIISMFDKTNFVTKVLKAGTVIPIPESYNQSALQLRLKSRATDSEWSDEWPVYALKNIVQVNKPGYLRHGKTFTFFRKV